MYKSLLLIIISIFCVNISTYAQNEEVFVTVEEMPSFKKGEKGLINYISKNIKYPEKEKKDKIAGVVYINFIVEKDGNISNAKVLKGANENFNREALRVVNSMPNWNPGKQSGKNVRVSVIIPIKFSPK